MVATSPPTYSEPELNHYHDSICGGCNHYTLECPLSECIALLDPETRQFRERAKAARALRRQGLTLSEIAGRMGCSLRSVYRYLAG